MRTFRATSEIQVTSTPRLRSSVASACIRVVLPTRCPPLRHIRRDGERDLMHSMRGVDSLGWEAISHLTGTELRDGPSLGRIAKVRKNAAMSTCNKRVHEHRQTLKT